MPRAMKASDNGLESHYKVRVVISGAILHLASWNEPRVTYSDDSNDYVKKVTAEWINDPAYGDTIGYIDWPEVRAVTWRFSE
jgi:hypothetical protein